MTPTKTKLWGVGDFLVMKEPAYDLGLFGGFVVFLSDARDRLTGRGYVEVTGRNRGIGVH